MIRRQRHTVAAASAPRFSWDNQEFPYHRLSSCLRLSSSTDVTSSSSLPASESILYDHEQEEDTIVALSSSSSSGGAFQPTAVAVIRLSGPQSHFLLQELMPNQSLPKPRQAAVRTLYDLQGDLLDQALVLRFDQPRSFTGEDVVEIQAHGSRAVVTGILQDLTARGARLAEPGEFTQRAFGAGKLNLLQVEALADLLTADTTRQRQQALQQQLSNSLVEKYQDWTSRLTSGLAHAEAVIDFGDDESLMENDDFDDIHVHQQRQQDNVWGGVAEKMQQLKSDMVLHLQDGRRGELVREGVRIGIVGPPNAGKSTLFNVLAQREAAIVSPLAGTTRDVLELSLDLGGVKCCLSDTAGVREAISNQVDVVEQEGIRRAKRVAQMADVIVAMMDATQMDEGMDVLQNVLNATSGNEEESWMLDPNHVLVVLNKQDLRQDSNSSITSLPQEDNPKGMLRSSLASHRFRGIFEISCETNQGVDSFLDALTETVISRISSPNDEATESHAEGAIITRARHRQHVQAAVEALGRFEMLSQQGTMVMDMAAEELRLATSELGRITGAVDVEDVLDVLFADFCIGK